MSPYSYRLKQYMLVFKMSLLWIKVLVMETVPTMETVLTMEAMPTLVAMPTVVTVAKRQKQFAWKDSIKEIFEMK